MVEAQIETRRNVADAVNEFCDFAENFLRNRVVFTDPKNEFIRQLDNYLNELSTMLSANPAEFRAEAQKLLTAFNKVEQAIPQFFREEERDEVEPYVFHMNAIKSQLLLFTYVPEREAEQRMQEGVEFGGLEPTSRPGAPLIEMPEVRKYLSEHPIGDIGVRLPQQWRSHFPDPEIRKRTDEEISDGYMRQLFSNDPRRGPTPASREHGQQVLANIAASVQETCGRTFTVDMLLDSTQWTEEERQHIMDMFGKEGMGEDRVVEILRRIGEGDFLGAVNRAPQDSTIGMALEENFRETLRQRFAVHVPIFGIALGVETNVLEERLNSFSTLRIPIRGILRAVMSGVYRPNVSFQRDEEGNITNLDLNLSYSGELVKELGGILGGGGEIGAEFTLGHEQRYIGIYAMVEYDPLTERPQIGCRIQFTDLSGEWTTPFDGILYPMVYAGVTTDFRGTSGEVYGGAMVEAGSSYLVFGDVSFFLILGGEYRYRWGGIEPSQSAPLQAGMGMSVGDVFRTDARVVWDPLSQSENPVGAVWNALFHVGHGISIGPSFTYQPITFDAFGRRQEVPALTGIVSVIYHFDER